MKQLGYAAVAACAFFGWQVTASAEELQVPQAPGVEEIVVTGSYIKGTPEDAALPVDVITQKELEERGNPSALDLIRAMPYVASVMGETNQFGANQGTIGSGNINLRGLGGIRTLVLMNGRRTTYTPAEGPAGVDTNLMPWAAIGRVEVLKDGAAATYGSDAIAGVVNLITRRDLDGLELNGEFRGIEDTDGDYTWYANWGWIGDHSNILVSYGQQYRAELQSTDRDWAIPPYLVNPTGWSGFSTPGTFNPRNAANANLTTAPVIDSNCPQLGGYQDPSVCRFSFIPFDNLVDETEMQQAYVEMNTEIADGVNFHVEGLWAETVLPNYRTSPGYPPLSGPAGPGSGQFVIQSDPGGPSPFSNNPSVLTALAQTGQSGLVGVDDIRLNSWRPYGWGGVQALTGGSGGQVNRNTFDMARVSASIDGSINVPFLEELGWDVAVTYSDSEMGRTGVDTMISRLESSLNGLGGAGCNGIPFGRTGSTCQYFNPFSNGIARNPAQGLVNPGFVPANENSPDLINWMIQRWNVKQQQSLLVVDAVVNAEIPGFELPGGAIGWALGTQYRLTDYQSSDTNPLIDAQANPCPTPGSNCAFKTGPFIFLGQFIDQELDDTVYSVFGELHAPITDKIDAQLAVRYEDYGGLTGDTTDPKLSLRWQALESLALRGSVGSTFRGPTPVNKSLIATGLQPIPSAGFVYKAIDFVGNPDLKPEKADTFSVGFVFELGGFKGIVDYWSYEFEDQITSVQYAFVTGAVLGAGTGSQFANCNHALRYLLTFDQNNTCTQGVTTASQMERVKAPVVNGAPVETTGYDMSVAYDFGEVFGGNLTAGIDATYVDKYEQDTFFFGGALISPQYEAAGNANYERFPGTIAQWRGLGNINYAWDAFNFRYELRYVDGVDDERLTPNVVTETGAAIPVTFGKEVEEYVISNLFVQWNAPWETVVSLSIVNLTDEDPSEARQALSYDPYIGDPLGRTWEIGIKKTFSAN